MDFSGGPVVKNSPANVGDMCSIPDLGRCHVPPVTNPSSHNQWSPPTLEPLQHNKSHLKEKPSHGN